MENIVIQRLTDYDRGRMEPGNFDRESIIELCKEMTNATHKIIRASGTKVWDNYCQIVRSCNAPLQILTLYFNTSGEIIVKGFYSRNYCTTGDFVCFGCTDETINEDLIRIIEFSNLTFELYPITKIQ